MLGGWVLEDVNKIPREKTPVRKDSRSRMRWFSQQPPPGSPSFDALLRSKKPNTRRLFAAPSRGGWPDARQLSEETLRSGLTSVKFKQDSWGTLGTPGDSMGFQDTPGDGFATWIKCTPPVVPSYSLQGGGMALLLGFWLKNVANGFWGQQ